MSKYLQINLVNRLKHNSTHACLFFLLLILGAAAPVTAADFSADDYEVFYGDFNSDGKAGDVYFHKKDTFVLIHGGIAIPLLIASADSYVVYEGTNSAVALKKNKAQLNGFELGELNSDYYFTDADGDGLVDIVSAGAVAVTLRATASTPQVVINTNTPENISGPTAPSFASNSLVTGAQKSNLDSLQVLAGKFRVDESGAATYSVPIAAPSGTAGVAPGISLNYSSLAGTGIAGKGWSVGGLGGISRCRQTLLQDGVASPITWSDEDRFCLDGSRLVLVDGVYGAPGSKYKTEIDSFRLVTAGGGSAGHPDYFVIEAKDGSTSYYGGAGNHSSEYAPYVSGLKQTAKVLTWKLRHFEDNVGNKIEYVYSDTAADHVIDSILYAFGGGSTHWAEIKFEYADEQRSDSATSYFSGYEFQSVRLLEAIVTRNKASSSSSLQTLYRYELEYKPDTSFPNHANIRLNKLKLCNASSCPQDAYLSFNWGTGTPGLAASFGVTDDIDLQILDGGSVVDYTTLDINGDGKTDLAWSLLTTNSSTGNYSYRLYSLLQGAERARLVASGVSASPVNAALSPLDYNSDGRSDIYFNESLYLAGPGVDGWVLTKLDEFDVEGMLNSYSPSFADINSDGLVDEIQFSSADMALKVRFMERDSSQNERSARRYSFGEEVLLPVSSSGATHTGIWRYVSGNTTFGDFNNDGRMDLAIEVRSVIDKRPAIETGPFDPGSDFDYDELLVYFVRSGDGYEFYHQDLKQQWRERNLGYSNGLIYHFESTYKLLPAADINGDSLPDIVYKHGKLKSWYYQLNTGTGFLPAVKFIEEPSIDKSAIGLSWVDYNADGYKDAVWDTGRQGVKYRLWDSQASAFRAEQLVPYTVDSEATFPENVTYFMSDFNGDGQNDLLRYDHGEQILATRRGYGNAVNQRSNLIQSIEDGRGNETAIQYGLVNYSDHYSSLENVYGQSVTRDYCHALSHQGGGTYQVCVEQDVLVLEEGDFYAQINSPFAYIDTSKTAHIEQPQAPVLELNAPYNIVTRVDASNPVASDADAISSVAYHYHQLRFQAGGRGMLGFKSLTQMDLQTGIATKTDYRQDWPFAGRPESTATFSPAGNIIKSAVNHYALNLEPVDDSVEAEFGFIPSNAYGPISLWTSEVVDTSYALVENGDTQGAPTKTIETSLVMDTYGNVTSQEVVTRGGDAAAEIAKRVTTTNTYLDEATYRGKSLGRLSSVSAETYRSFPEAMQTTRTSSFEYYGMSESCNDDTGNLTGMLCKESIPNSADTYHYYDSFGNKTFTKRVNPATSEARFSSYSGYDAAGRYVDKVYSMYQRSDTATEQPEDENYQPVDSANWGVVQISRVNSRNKFGSATSIEKFNGDNWLEARSYYTAFGNVYFSANEDGSYAISLASKDTARCPAISYSSRLTQSSDGSQSISCFDKRGRQVRAIALGFEHWVYTDTEYDPLGRASRVSEPYFAPGDDETPELYWTTVTHYDLLGRATAKSLPFNVTKSDGTGTTEVAVSTVDYNDQARTVTYTSPAVFIRDASGAEQRHTVEKRETYNVLGEIASVIEYDDGAPVLAEYEYDVSGNLTSVKAPGSVETVIGYNTLGLKDYMSDPDKGEWRYTYNAFGDIDTQTDGKNQRTLNCYDQQGRLTKRYDYTAAVTTSCVSPADDYVGYSEWEFDSGNYGLGQLAAESSGEITKQYERDSFGRASVTATTIAADEIQPGGTHYAKVNYDQYGRLFQQFDAARNGRDFTHSGTQNTYKNGYLWQVKNADINAAFGSGIYYEVLSMNTRGQVVHAEYADTNLTKTVTTNARTGRIEAIETFSALGGVIQSLDMRWDSLGNLSYRADKGKNVEGSTRNQVENFRYDTRNRLTGFKVDNHQELALTYHLNDNIKTKSDVDTAEYEYAGYGPHAVSHAGGRSYEYDANGNMTGEKEGNNSFYRREFTYNVFDKVSEISKTDGDVTRFYYDGNRNRYKRVDIDTDVTNNNRKVTTLYLGSVEKVFNADYTQQWKRSLPGGVQINRTLLNGNFQKQDVAYLLKDHLGSINAVVDSLGSLQQVMAFDPWGQRRDTLNWEKILTDISSFKLASKPVTTRGFTGHEMVDEMEIIHMNGRIYDARLGRFLQADPIVQEPTTIGSLNRYSYVMNNPLNAIDPSGYSWVSDRWNDLWDGVKPFAGAIVGVFLAVYAPWTAAWWGPIINGMIAGAAGAAVNGGNILKGAAFGAFTGAAFVAGDFLGAAKLGAAIGGGIIADVNGGSFVQGFASAGIGAAFGGSGEGFNAASLFKPAVLGRVVTRISGGKVASDAAGAAFMYAVSAGVGKLKSHDGGGADSGAQEGNDPHAGHDHSGPGGNPNPDNVTWADIKNQTEKGKGWTINEADKWHNMNVPGKTNIKVNDPYGHEEVFDLNLEPVRDHNGPTFNRGTSNLDLRHIFIDVPDYLINGTGWPDDHSSFYEKITICSTSSCSLQ